MLLDSVDDALITGYNPPPSIHSNLIINAFRMEPRDEGFVSEALAKKKTYSQNRHTDVQYIIWQA